MQEESNSLETLELTAEKYFSEEESLFLEA